MRGQLRATRISQDVAREVILVAEHLIAEGEGPGLDLDRGGLRGRGAQRATSVTNFCAGATTSDYMFTAAARSTRAARSKRFTVRVEP